MTEHQLTKSELATRELIFLRAADAMDTFASEHAERRPEREVAAEPLAAFAPEGFIHPPERFTYAPEGFTHPIPASVPIASKRPWSRMALTSLGVATAVAAFFLVERSAERVPPPIAPSEPSTLAPEVNAPAPVPPVVVADGSQPVVEVSQPPSPSPLVPEIEAAPPRPVLPVTPRIDPPRAASPSSSPQREASASSSRSRQLPSTAPVAPVAPPRSQAPPRVVGVPAPPPSRPSDVVPDAAVPAPVASVAAPIAEPALSPPAAPPASAALVPAPSPSPAPAPSPTTASPAAAPAAASAAVAPSAVESNTSGIQNTLARYRKAFSALDAGAAHQVWPTVNERTLQRAFARLEQQEVSFEGCRIAADLERAEATCVGTASYVPRVGSRTLRIDRRQWRFSLVKVRDEWLIGAVDAQ
jgi:hypothetical protein